MALDDDENQEELEDDELEDDDDLGTGGGRSGVVRFVVRTLLVVGVGLVVIGLSLLALFGFSNLQTSGGFIIAGLFLLVIYGVLEPDTVRGFLGQGQVQAGSKALLGVVAQPAPRQSGHWHRLRNVGGALRASTAAGSILAELLSGNRIQDSTLSTSAGDITVFIASNIPLTVLARNDSGGATGRIISDFKEIRVKPGSQPGASPVLAEGALNGGGPVLRINVNGGTIYLRRPK